jgi:hypothetical protein
MSRLFFTPVLGVSKMNKKKLRAQAKERSLLKQVMKSGCPECQPLSIPTVIMERTPDLTVGPTVNLECPFCTRKLKLPIGPEARQHSGMMDLLRQYGALIGKHRNIPATLYSFTLDGEEIFSDPPCGCESDCEHDVLTIQFQTASKTDSE